MVVGVDTIRVGGRSRRLFRAEDGWTTSGRVIEGRGNVVTSFRRKLDSGAVLDVMAGTDLERAYVEFSACKAVDSVHGVDLDTLRPLVEHRLDEAREWVEFDELNVNRLDVARSFQLERGELSAVLSSLADVPIGGRKVQELYRDSAAGNAQTVRVWNKSGMVRAYDKGAESGRSEAANLLRVESQDRGRTLRAQGVQPWATLNTEQVAHMGRTRFRWSGMGRLIAIQETNLDRILGCSELTDGQKAQAVAALALATAGRWDAMGGKDRRSRARKYLAMAGVGVELDGESPIIHGTAATVIRLDFDRGVLRGAEAA